MSDIDTCINVQGLSKKFSRSLKRSFVYGTLDLGRAVCRLPVQPILRKSEFWALRNIDLQLQRGQSIGIVGANGSGKTTLLRLISGIISPTTGSVAVSGRIAPMLALGAGFKPVLSGRDNIFLNLALLGVREVDVHARLDQIIEFSELGESIHAPLGTYSSGMLARLGFSCAVHTDPQLLIVDEVLSVGDARFRTKCRNRINELRRAGTSMLLVSHSSILIETLCDEAIYLKAGAMVASGKPADVLRQYESDQLALSQQANEAAKKARTSPGEPGSSAGQGLRVTAAEVVGATDSAGSWKTGKPGALRLTLQSSEALDDISINVMVFDQTHQVGETVLFMMSSRDIGWLSLDAGTSTLELKFDAVGLRGGTYRAKLSVSQGEMHDLLDVVEDIKLVIRDTVSGTENLYHQPRTWEMNGARVSRDPLVLEDAVEYNEEF